MIIINLFYTAWIPIPYIFKSSNNIKQLYKEKWLLNKSAETL